jgi:hypothetical protein
VVGDVRTYLHEQFHGLGECGNRLPWLFDRPDMLYSVLAMPNAFTDQPFEEESQHEMTPKRIHEYLSSRSSDPVLGQKNLGQGATRQPRRNGDLPGSWNITTTPSRVTWTSVDDDYGRESADADQLPLSMPSAPSRMAASKLARVFSGNREEAFETARTGA